MKKILFAYLLFLVGTCQMLALTRATLPGVGGTLASGYVYAVTSNTTLTQTTAGYNALNVASGATVTIYIAKGVTLTCTGGNGNYRTHGGAGIYVPSNSTLIITGEGTLVCTGGAAGRGTNGGSGSSGYLSKSGDGNGYGGKGGDGGAGGGGAGAGIGGYGGDGATPNVGQSSPNLACFKPGYRHNGVDGAAPRAGSNGVAMGNVYAVSTVTIKATAGAPSTTAGSAGSSRGGRVNDSGSGWKNNYSSGGGGRGAGGGSGYGASYGIGGGAPGAQCGASGGSGGTYVKDGTSNGWDYLDGEDAYAGGVGYRTGSYNLTNGATWAGGYRGGYGGSAKASYASAGGHGNFYAMTTVNRTNAGRTPTTITTPPTAIRTTTTFDLQGAGTNYTQYHYYGIKRDKVGVPVKAGMHFKGYYNAASGGTQYYNEKGEAVSDNGLSLFAVNTTLYAQFEDKVAPTTDGGMVLQQNTNVTMDDVKYMLDKIEGTDVKNRLDLSKATTIADPDNLVMTIRADKHFSNNTFIYVPEGTTFQHDEHTENVIYKDGSGKISCPNLRVYDGVDMVIPEAFTAANARYDRYGSHRWGTICVPFELESDAIVQFYTSGLISQNGVLVLQKAATVEPGQPAIYQISYIDGSNKDDIYLGEANTPVVTGIKPAESDINLLGTFQSKSITDEGLYYYSDNSFYLKTPEQPLTVPAFRAYIEMKQEEVANAPRRLRIADADNPTAIYELELEAAEDLAGSAAYDLSGRRVGGTHNQGVIIRNGKKIVR